MSEQKWFFIMVICIVVVVNVCSTIDTYSTSGKMIKDTSGSIYKCVLIEKGDKK